ncbi:MAG: lipoprotein [Proteobacteria bacterium]|nr:lipoprotein [Pseudomonadota bacterium]
MAGRLRKTFVHRLKSGSSGWKKSENWADAENSVQFPHPPGLARAGQSLYGAAALGDIAVNRTSSPVSARWALIVLAAATLALAGCGRKGGLDLPPTASEQSRAAAAADDEARAAGAKGSLFDPSYGMNSDPVASKGTKKPFLLDPLLDSH